MKKLIIIFMGGLLAQQIIQAQGTLYLSNLGQPSTSSLNVGSNSLQAVGFFTGTNTSGYLLDSIQLAMTNATGNSSGFTVMVYTQSGNPAGASPGSSLDTLDGSLNPTTGGTYIYTATSNLILSPSTDYFIVLAAGTAIVNGAYEWSQAGTYSYNPIENWGAGTVWNSVDGSHWNGNTFLNPEFAITATPIPEPSSEILLGLGGLLLALHRAKQRLL